MITVTIEQSVMETGTICSVRAYILNGICGKAGCIVLDSIGLPSQCSDHHCCDNDQRYCHQHDNDCHRSVLCKKIRIA